MAALVTVTADYKDDADDLFASALDFREMTDAMKGIAVYEGGPDGPVAEGMTFSVDVAMFGVMKTNGHAMHVETLDRPNRILQSREHSPAVKRWDHRLTIDQDGDVARWTDRIEIDAGWRTFGAARFARFIYAYRHRRRGALTIAKTVERA
ncbi:MAG: hypothetical protein AAFX08_11845 [Pseudomonadota bacterium]